MGLALYLIWDYVSLLIRKCSNSAILNFIIDKVGEIKTGPLKGLESVHVQHIYHFVGP